MIIKWHIFAFLLICCCLQEAISQPCGSARKTYDYQQVMKDGRLVLLEFDPKGVFSRYTIVSPKGKILVDSLNSYAASMGDYDPRYCLSNSLELPYGFNRSAIQVANCSTCWNYLAMYTKENELVLGRFRLNDPKYLFITKFDSAGVITEQKLGPETIGLDSSNDDLQKFKRFRVYLEDRFGSHMIDSNGYLHRFNFEKDKTVDMPRDNMNLEQVAVKTQVAYSDDLTLYKWKLNGPDWEFLLDGDLVAERLKDYKAYAKGPLINKHRIHEYYITVYNKDQEHCRGYGRDIAPIIYKFDLKKGIKLWELELGYD